MDPIRARPPRRPLVTLILACGAIVPACAPPPGPEPGRPGTGAETRREGPRPYAQVITREAVTDSGVFHLHRVGEKLYFEIPDSLLDRDMLLISRVAAVPSGTFVPAGQKAAEQVVRWEHRVGPLVGPPGVTGSAAAEAGGEGPSTAAEAETGAERAPSPAGRILLRKVSYEAVADDTLAIHRSVVKNNFAPVVRSWPVEAVGPEGDTRVIDVTSLFTSDVPAISGVSAGLRRAWEIRRLDADRTFIAWARSYPLNVEVRHVLTFEANQPPAEANTATVSMEMNQSLVLLPAAPMRPRHADPRVGYFTVDQVNFGLDEQKAATQRFIRRWRLEPSDPAAYARGELVEPVKPIVYWLDPATPPRWRPWVRRGVEDWQAAFESAGFRNAIVARDPPSPAEDPEWNTEDVRYSVVRWAATLTRNAQGPSVSDPRTGEIIESDIVWHHNHLRSYRNRLLLETGAANPLARSLPVDAELLGEAVRQVIAHEVGHALGLPHNMISSSAYPVDSLRNPEYARRMGVAPSIMDYARQNYIAQPGDGLRGADFIRRIGPYDHYAIEWGYRMIPEARTPEEEKATLDAWILARAGDPTYRFAPQRAISVNPDAQTEDLGDDPVAASGYGIANLRRVLPNLVAWTGRPGEDWTDLEELYGELVFQWRRYVGHVVTVVGGVHQDLKAADQEGPVYRPADPDRQRAAVEFVAREAFAGASWLNDPEILGRIEHAGGADRVRGLQARFLFDLLDPRRMQRLAEAEAAHPGRAYPLAEFLDDVRRAVWNDPAAGRPVDVYRRALQRAHVERLEWLLTEEPPDLPASPFFTVTPVNVAQSDIRPLVRAQLRELGAATRRGAGRAREPVTRAHLADLADRIERILEGRER